MPEGQASPGLETRKRRKEEEPGEEEVLKKKGNSALEKCEKVRGCVMIWGDDF